jgi:hypothetical protein
MQSSVNQIKTSVENTISKPDEVEKIICNSEGKVEKLIYLNSSKEMLSSCCHNFQDFWKKLRDNILMADSQ